ncbi:hypothetical protein SAMN02745163_00431 [Clostridium cavendishii DSM 21758]|uniref:UDP-N-acetylglucosamine:LPS N-acetylglucosamine transferase n=1 Tax=Clostridium cavendishii DSM 21758 TaxID=1121302 RepID=A0A1M6CCX9_9CLOT|nr:hypothetical protein [Clostridium cavendishii]SHI58614.1 hypothetical protein SAMN02745163_00431 [Clostridium cavendishii DSM 21758]
MKVAVLCSGVGLGVYVPGLIINRDLKKNDISSEVFVLENLIVEEKKDKIPINKDAYHKNFSVALVGLKISKDMMSSICNQKLENIIDYWFREKINYFIVVSGFWLPIIELYKQKYNELDIHCECIHIDSDFSASWKKVKNIPSYCHNEFLYSYNDNKLLKDLLISDESPIEFKDREDRLLIHGGGWGLGTYTNKINELNEFLIKLYIIAYDYSEVKFNDELNRYFMIDPSWNPWIRDKDDNYIFPPFAEVKTNVTEFKSNDNYPDVFNLIRKSKGIVSKPGGATLIDSLSSATPLIMLEPFGEYEKKNATLWQSLGFGIYYDDFIKIHYKMEFLEKLHLNILNEIGKRESYTSYLINKINGGFLCNQILM